ncbi:DUF4124 domain-containing protein [Kangiella shandongensis]|uniref:DUF4124 domain-containing protein n=1 Tax=Kangiella shandongensis TaxID=2763258 RepID=UPI001CBFF396|nr:DUF4124 domain-containing protein [Kangiella shandongensis]
MISKRSLIITALLALAVSFSAVADKPIYKWKDSQGNIKYTQSKPPRGTDYETIYQRTSTATKAQSENSQADSAEANDSLDDVIAKQNKQKDVVAQKNAEIARKNCTIAKNNLEVLQSRTRVQVEENGQRRMLTDQERADKLEKAKANVDKFCNQ